MIGNLSNEISQDETERKEKKLTPEIVPNAEQLVPTTKPNRQYATDNSDLATSASSFSSPSSQSATPNPTSETLGERLNSTQKSLIEAYLFRTF